MSHVEEHVSGERSLELGGLLLAVVFAGSVLAFGGVITTAYVLMEASVLLAAVLCFWRGWPRIPRLALLVMGLLVALPLLQLVPLPASLVSAISPNRVAFTERLFSWVSPAPTHLPLSLNAHATEVALLKLIAYLLAFLIGYRLAAAGRGAILVYTLLIVGAFEAVYGIVQYLADWHYIFTYKKVFYTGDATGTYINRNHFAGLLEMVVPFVLARVLFRSRRSTGARLRLRVISAISSAGTSKFIAQSMLLAVLLLALFFSRSRMGIVSALLGIMLVGLLHFLRARQRSVLAMLLLLLLIPACYALWIGTDAVISRFEVLGQQGAMERDRLPVWRDTLGTIRDFRWVGTGLGAYESIFGRYQTNYLYTRYEHAHSDYLEFAAELGIPATALLFGALWALMLAGARAAIVLDDRNSRVLAAGSAGALAAILLHSVTDFNLQIPANALLFFWVAGTAAGVTGGSGLPGHRLAVKLTHGSRHGL